MEKARKTLRDYFGYESFRPMQEKAVKSVMSGRDTVVLMPTGGGKSMVFQVPSICLQGTGIIVSPLIALMKDQVDGLKTNGVKAAYLNSTQSRSQQQLVIQQLRNQNIDLLYVSPEKLCTEDFFYLLKTIKISLFAIDEAHCISSWGHDFRPEYTKLNFLTKEFPEVPVVALTATADKLTREDIVNQLGLRNPEVLIDSFNRPNLSLNVLPGQKKFESIVRYLNGRESYSGVIYCLSRKSTEQLAEKLRKHGFYAEAYHAGLSNQQRSKVQEDFLRDRIRIVVATIAFGMGIDKSNIRFVIHYNLPKNIEGFYQEIGRAGRDGLPSDTLLFYSFADIIQLRKIIEDSGQKEVQQHKLKQMQNYAETQICRRKILLAYFNEDMRDNCGNCDVCKDPPKTIDGTIIAQKALSALLRMNENVGTYMLIDVLRGSGRRDVMQRGFHQIKTFGQGKELSQELWQAYLLQLMQQGFIELAIDDHNTLKVTDSGREVLFEGRRVQLAEAQSGKQLLKKKEQKAVKKELTPDEELFAELRSLRLQEARERDVPAYVVFSDAALKEMASEKPVSDAAFLSISGVGNKKLEDFGPQFMDLIRKYCRKQSSAGIAGGGNTYEKTWELIQKGASPEQVAKDRYLNETTVYSHIAYLYEKGYPIQIQNYIEDHEVENIITASECLGHPEALKPIFDFLKEEVPYSKIRLAKSIMQQRMNSQNN